MSSWKSRIATAIIAGPIVIYLVHYKSTATLIGHCNFKENNFFF